jgi:hypothetical protein
VGDINFMLFILNYLMRSLTICNEVKINMGGWLAKSHGIGKKRQGTTSQAAEKLEDSGKSGGKHPSGAKAQHLFCCICGTTKVVP